VPDPKIGANKLLPMQTCCLKHGQYDIKADLSGIIWSVAPVSATRRLVQGRWASENVLMECARGLFRSPMACLGRHIVVTSLGLTAVQVEFAQIVGVSAGDVLQMALEEVWEHECGSRE
jgi:hypothetical protein